MKKTKSIFLLAALVPFVAACEKPEGDSVKTGGDEGVTYTLTANPAFVDNAATLTVTASSAVSADVLVDVLLGGSNTIPSANLTYDAVITVKKGETSVSSTVYFNPEGLSIGQYKAVFSVKVDGKAVEGSVTIHATVSEGEKPGGGDEDSSLDGWGIVGTNTDWADDADIPMVKSGEPGWVVADDLVFDKKGEENKFKIRKNGDYALGDVGLAVKGNVPLDEEFEVVEGTGAAKTMLLPKLGTYTIWFNPGMLRCKVVLKSELNSDEPGNEPGDDPGDEPAETQDVWSVNGTNNGWGDTDMTLGEDGWWTAKGVVFDSEEENKFKLRLGGSYDKGDVGLATKGTVPLDEEFDVVNGTGLAKTMLLPRPGTYDISFNPDRLLCKVHLVQ